jgi:hypothetical protein
MDASVIFGLFFFILAIIGLIAAVPFLIRELKSAANSVKTDDIPESEHVFARFSFTKSEWDHLYLQEFVENDGKSLFDEYAGIIRSDTIERKHTEGEIFFLPESIYVTNGTNGKLYKVNDLNSAGNGIRLVSIDLLNTSPLKKLRIQIRASSITEALNSTSSLLEYSIPLPGSSDGQIDKILAKYCDIIALS